MNWAKQNASALEELRSIFPAGVHDLEILTGTSKSKILLLLDENSENYGIVLKTREIWHEHVLANFIYEIAFFVYLWKKFPEFRNQIPRLYGIVRDSQEQVVGIVMEKFPGDVSKYYQVGQYSFEDEKIIRNLKDAGFDDGFLNSLEYSLFGGWIGETFVKKICDTEDVGRELAKNNQTSKIRRLLRRYARFLLSHPEIYSINLEAK